MRYQHLLFLPQVLSLSPQEFALWNPNKWTENITEVEGTCNTAVDVMSYHRDKMNEYLCKKFLAEEIVAAESGDVLESRADSSQLLDDTGSEKYQDWLARSTTLEDIYKHYEQNTAADAPISASVPLDPFDGEVTGYAMLGNNGKVAAEPTDYGLGGGSTYGAPLGPMYGGNGHTYVQKASGPDKGMKLDDLFHLALTAIAFMAFGTFACEIIMCIMDVDTNAKQSKLTVISTNEPFDAYYKSNEQNYQPELKTEENTYERIPEAPRRRGRSLVNLLSDVSSFATASLDGMENLHIDGGRRLRRTLCQANRYSTSLIGRQRIWIPLWSFGVSWISGRHLSEAAKTSFGTLKFLTATVQGMAGVNCSTIS